MRALVVVDVQQDFCEGGALAVSGGNSVAEKIAWHINKFGYLYDQIIFTKDWHRPMPDTNGGHFSDTPDFKDTWPPHCVMLTEGAKFHPALTPLAFLDGLEGDDRIFYKGSGLPAYSGFQGFNRHGLSLDGYLIRSQTFSLDIVGIAGDYCVKQTAEDALGRGYFVRVIPEMIASVGGDEATQQVLGELSLYPTYGVHS